jgi:hypothetical protein
MRSSELGRPGHHVALDRRPVGLLDGPQSDGHSRLAACDGLAVASAVGALGKPSAELLDLAEVGFALVGVGGDGEYRDVGGGGVHDEADRLGLGVATGKSEDPGAVDVGPGLLGVDAALPDLVVELSEHYVGPIDLVTCGGEVLADGAEVGAAVNAVSSLPSSRAALSAASAIASRVVAG